MKLLNLKKEEKVGAKTIPQKDTDIGKEKKTLLSKILNMVGIVICVLLIPVLVINGTMLVKTVIHPNTPPDFMGYIPLVVGDENMSSVFDDDDLVIIKIPDAPNELEVSEIITFWANDILLTRRIVGTELDDNQQVMYVTKMDTNDAEDQVRIAPAQILGVYKTHIDDIGSFVLFMQTPAGILSCVVLPLAIIFLVFYFRDKVRYEKALKRQHENDTQANASLEQKENGNDGQADQNVTQQPEVQN